MIVVNSNANKQRKTSLWFGATFLFILSFAALGLQSYTVDNKSSKIGFAGEHAGMNFSGVFEKWQAKMVLPPAENPMVSAEFELKSAKTGDFTYDSTLPEGDWFDVKNHPIGRFTSESVLKVADGYKVLGSLELRGISKPQSFVLKQNGNKLNAQFTINRLEYGIGLESDPEADWVSRDIMITLNLSL